MKNKPGFRVQRADGEVIDVPRDIESEGGQAIETFVVAGGVRPNPLEGVQFASDAAAELAIAKRLTAASFTGREPSSESGFTKRDVEQIDAA